jgi:hypothetical protein
MREAIILPINATTLVALYFYHQAVERHKVSYSISQHASTSRADLIIAQ